MPEYAAVRWGGCYNGGYANGRQAEEPAICAVEVRNGWHVGVMLVHWTAGAAEAGNGVVRSRVYVNKRGRQTQRTSQRNADQGWNCNQWNRGV